MYMSYFICAVFSVAFSVILFDGNLPEHDKLDFAPALQNALDVIATQKNETESAICQIREELDPATAGRFASGYDAMTEAFNQTIESIIIGDAPTISAARTEIRNSVKLNRVWLEAIKQTNEKFSAKFASVNESAVAEAWKTIVQASQTLDKTHKKKLSQHLEKYARWKTLSELASELSRDQSGLRKKIQ